MEAGSILRADSSGGKVPFQPLFLSLFMLPDNEDTSSFNGSPIAFRGK
jgi:hypothetical protein